MCSGGGSGGGGGGCPLIVVQAGPQTGLHLPHSPPTCPYLIGVIENELSEGRTKPR